MSEKDLEILKKDLELGIKHLMYNIDVSIVLDTPKGIIQFALAEMKKNTFFRTPLTGEQEECKVNIDELINELIEYTL